MLISLDRILKIQIEKLLNFKIIVFWNALNLNIHAIEDGSERVENKTM